MTRRQLATIVLASAALTFASVYGFTVWVLEMVSGDPMFDEVSPGCGHPRCAP